MNKFNVEKLYKIKNKFFNIKPIGSKNYSYYKNIIEYYEYQGIYKNDIILLLEIQPKDRNFYEFDYYKFLTENKGIIFLFLDPEELEKVK